MKIIFKFLLVVSLVANLGFGLVLMRGAMEKSGAARERAEVKNPVAADTTPAAAPQVWKTVESDDLSALSDRLRDAGFPPHILRAIVAAQLHRDFAARRKAIEGEQDRVYWKSETIDPKRQIELRQLSREERKQLRAILGPDADSDGASLVYRDRGLTGLPPEKVEAARAILRDFDEQRQDFYNSISIAGSISMSQADADKMKAIEKAQHAELAKLLTPQELETYDLSASNTAQSLRYQLAAFNPTEQEFRALYKLQSDFDERIGPQYGPLNQDQMRAYMDAQKQLKEQIKLTLGPERAAEYERATDYGYRQTSALVARLELPAETTNQLYDLKKEFEQKRSEAMRGVSSREEIISRMTAVQQLQQEAAAKATTLLGGSRGLEAYKQYGGSWLNNMVPRTPPQRATAPKS